MAGVTARPAQGMPGNYAPALTVGNTQGGYSVLPTNNQIVSGGPRGANPVNSTAIGARPGVGLVGGIESTPAVNLARNLHPRLNTLPWSISMAQPRSESRTTKTRHNRKKGYNAQ